MHEPFLTPSRRAGLEVVGIGSSAGGLRALSEVLPSLPLDFPASVVLVQHVSPQAPSLLAESLGRRCRLPVDSAKDGERLLPGHVYVAPPGLHVIGPRAIAVILSGTGTDGADGLRAIKARGGMVIVQDQPTADFFGMPGAAIDATHGDFVLPLGSIADALVGLVVPSSS